jgi:hypothetical protein
MLQKVKIICVYAGYKAAAAFIKRFSSHNKCNVGRINFYGSKQIVGAFEEALRVELPKYDRELSESIQNGNIELDIIYNDQLDQYIPQVGIFFAPRWIFDYGSEGICQYIVYCIIGSSHTGIGLRATLSHLDRKKVISACNDAMRDWIKQKNFPEQWLSSYNNEENLTALKKAAEH